MNRAYTPLFVRLVLSHTAMQISFKELKEGGVEEQQNVCQCTSKQNRRSRLGHGPGRRDWSLPLVLLPLLPSLSAQSMCPPSFQPESRFPYLPDLSLWNCSAWLLARETQWDHWLCDLSMPLGYLTSARRIGFFSSGPLFTVTQSHAPAIPQQ